MSAPRPLIEVITREQRHAFMRMQFACAALADPDASARDRASALTSLYRGYRALEKACPPDRNLRQSVTGLDTFLGRLYNGT